MKNTFVRSIPFLLAFCAGLAVFLTAMFILQDGNLYDIFIEISGALLGVPIVFVIYDYTDYLISRRVNKTLFNGIKFEVNSVISQAVKVIDKIVNVKTKDIIQKLLVMRTSEIKKDIRMNKNAAKVFKDSSTKLMNLIYHGSNASVMDHDVLQNVMLIAKEFSILSELGDKSEIAAHIKQLAVQIDNWNDSSAQEELKEKSQNPK